MLQALSFRSFYVEINNPAGGSCAGCEQRAHRDRMIIVITTIMIIMIIILLLQLLLQLLLLLLMIIIIMIIISEMARRDVAGVEKRDAGRGNLHQPVGIRCMNLSLSIHYIYIYTYIYIYIYKNAQESMHVCQCTSECTFVMHLSRRMRERQCTLAHQPVVIGAQRGQPTAVICQLALSSKEIYKNN